MRSFVLSAIATAAVVGAASFVVASDADAATRHARHVQRTQVAPFARAYNSYGGPAVYGGPRVFYGGSRSSGPVVNGVAFPPSGGAP